MTMKTIVLLLPLLFLTASLSAQNYKEMVWNAMKELNELKKPSKNNRYHFKYKVRSVPRNNPQKALMARVETIVAADRIVIKSDKGDYYQDPKNAFTIVKDAKKVVWNNSPQDAWSKQDFSGFNNLKKAFFDGATYSRVRRQGEPEGIVLLKMLPELEVRKKGLVDYLMIEIDTKANRVTRLLTMYNQASPQKLTEYIYEKMDLKSNAYIAKRAIDYVMTNNQLKSSYRNYELIDLRNETRNPKK